MKELERAISEPVYTAAEKQQIGRTFSGNLLSKFYATIVRKVVLFLVAHVDILPYAPQDKMTELEKRVTALEKQSGSVEKAAVKPETTKPATAAKKNATVTAEVKTTEALTSGKPQRGGSASLSSIKSFSGGEKL